MGGSGGALTPRSVYAIVQSAAEKAAEKAAEQAARRGDVQHEAALARVHEELRGLSAGRLYQQYQFKNDSNKRQADAIRRAVDASEDTKVKAQRVGQAAGEDASEDLQRAIAELKESVEKGALILLARHRAIELADEYTWTVANSFEHTFDSAFLKDGLEVNLDSLVASARAAAPASTAPRRQSAGAGDSERREDRSGGSRGGGDRRSSYQGGGSFGSASRRGRARSRSRSRSPPRRY